MWIYGQNDAEAINMMHVESIRLQGEADKVLIVARTITEDEIILHSASSGADARDWLQRLLKSVNAGDNLPERMRHDTYGIG